MRTRIIQALFILVMVAGVGFIVIHYRHSSLKPAQAIDQDQADSDFLRAEMKVCYGKAQSDDCYKQAAHDFMAKWDYPKVLELLTENEQYPEVFGRCHELTHYIGRQAYEEEQSVAKVYSQASPVCWGGFYHGVMEEYFWDKHLSLTNPDDPVIIDSLNTACGKVTDYASPRFYTECIHGIGHAMMFITNTDLNKSLALCDKLTSENPTTCYGGVFMENSSSSTNTAHPTKFLSASDPMYPCDALAVKYLPVCYQYQSSYFAQLSNYDWQKNSSLCQQVPAAYEQGCFSIIGSNQVGFTQDYAKMKADCDLMPNPTDINICYNGVVGGLSGRYVNQINMIAPFCAGLDSANQEGCYIGLGQNIRSWTTDASKIANFCTELNNNEDINWCVSGRTFNSNSQSFH